MKPSNLQFSALDTGINDAKNGLQPRCDNDEYMDGYNSIVPDGWERIEAGQETPEDFTLRSN